jgi:hypothetical protein
MRLFSTEQTTTVMVNGGDRSSPHFEDAISDDGERSDASTVSLPPTEVHQDTHAENKPTVNNVCLHIHNSRSFI